MTVDKRMGGVVVAAGLGLALSTGYGVAAAEPSTSEASGATTDAGPARDKPEESTEPAENTDTDDDAEVDTEDEDEDPDEAEDANDDEVAVRDDRDSDDDTPTPQEPDAEPDEVDVALEVTPTVVTPVPAPVVPEPVSTTPAPSFAKPKNVGKAPAPAESPIVLAVLAWVRRQFADATTTHQGSGPPAAVSTSQPVTTVNVRDYGAVGDGIADDSAAIKAAEAALTSGGRLYFAEGDYRFAQQHPAGNAAVLLRGLSNVTVEFAPGARLLMDNLDANGHGTGHGIRVEGAASHVTILNATIEWVTRPAARSFGDGVSVLGWPSDTAPPAGWTGSTGTVEFVSIVNTRVVNAPQTGAVVMGASDVTVTDFTAVGTLADGLHFNANRRVTVDGLTAQDTGDDGLAFVTYYHASQPWTYGPTDGPFNQAGLGEWNNGGSVATNITVTGGAANGVRVQGGYDITITDVTVTGKEFGLQVNSAIATGPGDWTSLASRDIRISEVSITGVQTGIVLATNNIDGTEASMWWDFSGLSISDVTIRGARNWSLAAETPAATTTKFAGVTLRKIHAESLAADGPYGGGNGGILLASLRDSVIDDVRLVADHASDINLLGASQIRGHLGVADLPSSNLTVTGLVLEGPGRILIQDIAGVQFGDVASYGANSSAVVLYRVADSSFDTITAYLPARGAGEGYGVRLLQLYEVDIANIAVTMDDHVGSSWWAVELGGGNPDQDIAGQGVRVANVTYVSGRDDSDSDIVVQGGPYGPVDWYISAVWLHQGEAQPQWRSAVYGDTTPL